MIEKKRTIRRYHPGVYVKDALDALNMSSKEFSIRTGISERTLSDLINEKGSITFDIATKLSEFFGNSVNSWTNLQNAYDIYMLESKQKAEAEEDYALLKQFRKYLIDNSFIDTGDDNETVVYKTRSILSVNRLSALNTKELLVSFKEQNTDMDENNYFAQNFWLAYAMTKAREIEVEPYSKKNVIETMDNLKDLLCMEPKEFYPIITDRLRKCGISYVFLPYLEKSYIYGATKWLSNDNVMLAMSNRTGRADVFWFTLLHELTHVLKEHKRYCLLQAANIDDEEADDLASRILIPEDEWNDFIKNTKYLNSFKIKSFAESIGVPPFIVVGRLAREHKISYGSNIYKENMISYKNEEFLKTVN